MFFVPIESGRIFGLARITDYKISFDTLSYTIAIREVLFETMDKVRDIEDYEINVKIALNETAFMKCMRDPAFSAMQESWMTQEDDCYFEHEQGTRSALMTLGGKAVLVPIHGS